jgi:hypothetical protein
MRLRTLVTALALLAIMSGVAYAAGNFRQVKPEESDPGKTFLVQAQWLRGIGCPTNAKTFDGTTHGTFTDPACPTGDEGDKHNEGLLLAKTGPSTNDASAEAQLKEVKGLKLTELGYDLRKPGKDQNDPRGSHCGNGSPRFNVELKDGTVFFIGCNSPTPTTTTPGLGWMRLRWGGSAPLLAFAQNGDPTCQPCSITGKEVKRIDIVFDEGQDTGPDNFGLAVLDNIDVNGMIVGSHEDREDHDNDKDNDSHKAKHHNRDHAGDDHDD